MQVEIIIGIYFVEMQVEMIVEFHPSETQVEMIVGIYFVEML